jgi:hypothetical protein
MMKKPEPKLPRSPALRPKSLKIRPLGVPSGPNQGVNYKNRTGAQKNRPKKSMLSQADLKAFKKVMSAYGSRAKGKKKTMSKAAIAQRRAAGRASARKRGFYFGKHSPTLTQGA